MVNSYEGLFESGPLSVDVTTLVRYSFKNIGPVSILGSVPVHLYMDSIMVREQSWQW